ncbi:hypothetical protein K3217_00615 [bacterium BD-1]|nr:hypothetical protein [Ottowia caeni]
MALKKANQLLDKLLSKLLSAQGVEVEGMVADAPLQVPCAASRHSGPGPGDVRAFQCLF